MKALGNDEDESSALLYQCCGKSRNHEDVYGSSLYEMGAKNVFTAISARRSYLSHEIEATPTSTCFAFDTYVKKTLAF